MVATFCVGSATAWLTTTTDGRLLSYDSVLFDPRLSKDIPKVSVSLVADHRLFCEFLLLSGVDLEVVPGFVEDLLEVRETPVVLHD